MSLPSRELEEKLKQIREYLEGLKRSVEELARRYVQDVYEYAGEINSLYRRLLDVERVLFDLKTRLGIDPPRVSSGGEELQILEKIADLHKKLLDVKNEVYNKLYEMVIRGSIPWSEFKKIVDVLY